MPTANFKTDQNLDMVYPPFLERLFELVARCNARGSRYLFYELYRSYDRSAALKRAYLAGGPRAAGPGASGHNFGLAGDGALIIQESPKRVLRWDQKDFDVLVEEAVKLGLKSGRSYGDSPHVEWPTFVTARELDPLDLIYRKTPGTPLLKLKAVWAYVDAHAPNLPRII